MVVVLRSRGLTARPLEVAGRNGYLLRAPVAVADEGRRLYGIAVAATVDSGDGRPPTTVAGNKRSSETGAIVQPFGPVPRGDSTLALALDDALLLEDGMPRTGAVVKVSWTFFLSRRAPPRSTLFPYTTLFR